MCGKRRGGVRACVRARGRTSRLEQQQRRSSKHHPGQASVAGKAVETFPPLRGSRQGWWRRRPRFWRAARQVKQRSRGSRAIAPRQQRSMGSRPDRPAARQWQRPCGPWQRPRWLWPSAAGVGRQPAIAAGVRCAACHDCPARPPLRIHCRCGCSRPRAQEHTSAWGASDGRSPWRERRLGSPEPLPPSPRSRVAAC